MTAEAIAVALGGRRAGDSWIARCPFHEDRVPSLSIRGGSDGRVLVKCHAGCSQRDVIDALRDVGLWPTPSLESRESRPPRMARFARHASASMGSRREAAMLMWNSAEPASGTLTDVYLRNRGIEVPLPDVLRFSRALKHPTGAFLPAMVALITDGTNHPVAIHRTFLASDGIEKASVEPQKMMLGPCRGGSVRLAPAHEVVMIGEGIETCLAAMQATGTPTWAALSTSGLRSVEIPPEIREVVVLADGDAPGEAAASDAGHRLRRLGHHVRIARPPTGLDFNDVLLGHSPPHAEVTT